MANTSGWVRKFIQICMDDKCKYDDTSALGQSNFSPFRRTGCQSRCFFVFRSVERLKVSIERKLKFNNDRINIVCTLGRAKTRSKTSVTVSLLSASRKLQRNRRPANNNIINLNKTILFNLYIFFSSALVRIECRTGWTPQRKRWTQTNAENLQGNFSGIVVAVVAAYIRSTHSQKSYSFSYLRFQSIHFDLNLWTKKTENTKTIHSFISLSLLFVSFSLVKLYFSLSFRNNNK